MKVLLMKKSASDQWQPDDQNDLLQFVGGLPPIEMIGSATTDDQRESVKALFLHYQLLKDSLEAYFAGQKSPIEDRQLRASVEADMEFYLAFYNLVWFGWREIEAEVQSSELGDLFLYEQPGDVLKGLLFWECFRVWQVTMDKYFSPNKREMMALLDGEKILPEQRNRTFCEEEKKFHETEIVGAILNGEEPLPKWKAALVSKRLKRTLEYGVETLGDGGVAPKLAALCEFAINKRLRGNPTLRKKLKEYREAKKNRSKATKKLLRG